MKKYCMYLVFTLLTVFSFNMRVYAAKELTCVYEWDSDKKERVVVVQESTGSRSIFVTKNKDYTIDSLEYGAWEKTTTATTDSGKWVSCKKGYSVTSEGKISFKDSGSDIGLETSYSDALSPLVDTEMFIMTKEIESIADENGSDIEEYFSNIANDFCFYKNLGEGECRILAQMDGKYVVHQLTSEQFNPARQDLENIMYGKIVGLGMPADNLSQLYNNFQEFNAWLKNKFCVANSDNKFCKMVFDYEYKTDEGNTPIDDNVSRSCYVIFKHMKSGNDEKDLNFKLSFYGDDNFEVSYVPFSWESTDYRDHFTVYEPYVGNFSYHDANIHLYPRGSNLYDFGVEYIKAYKAQSDCPEITLCVDDASAGGNLNWYLELGSADEINKTGKYTIGMCYDYDEETGEIENIYVRDESIYNLLNGIITIEDCMDLFTGNEDSEKLLKIIKMLFTLSRILIPLVIIGMGSMDFVKCIFSGNEDGMKKAQSKFMKRILIGVVIFLVPSLLQYILEIAHHVWPNISSDLCGIL